VVYNYLMKKISKTLSYVGVLIILIVLLFASLTFFGGANSHPPVHASTGAVNCPADTAVTNPTCLSGWAWSSNVGWVSFNSNNTGAGGGTYDVAMDSSGNLSGYAWSSNSGWISFNSLVNSSDGKCPTETSVQSGDVATNCRARVNTTTGAVYGWARAIAGCQSDNWNGSACVGVGPGKDNGVSGSNTSNITSANYTWTRQPAAGNKWWDGFAASGDGKKLVAVGSDNFSSYNIYISNDGGVTWNTVKTGLSGVDAYAASTQDGNQIVVSIGRGGIWISKDGGSTWVQTSAPTTGYGNGAGWGLIVSSSDGKKLAAQYDTDTNTYIYSSNDFGQTWTTNGSPAPYYTLAMSQDGSKLFTSVIGNGYCGNLYSSSDNGLTWNTIKSGDCYTSIASSADGKKVFVTSYNLNSPGYSFLSIDGGSTWKPVTSLGVGYWNQSYSSANGNVLAVDCWHVSIDSGVNWTTQTSSMQDCGSGAMSSDGTKIVWTDSNPGGDVWAPGYIYTAAAPITTTSSANTGWDGWIHLSGSNNQTRNFLGTGGVTYSSSTNQFLGYAWGSNVIGWLQFTPTGSTGTQVASTTLCQANGVGCGVVSIDAACSINSTPYQIPAGQSSVSVVATIGNYSGGVAPYSTTTATTFNLTAGTYSPTVSITDSATPNKNTRTIPCGTITVIGGNGNGPICTVPSNSSLCNLSDLNQSFTGKNTSSPNYDNSCSTGNFCAFKCQTGFHVSGNSCSKSTTIEL